VSRTEAQKLPEVWNVPLARNRFFTGRVDELDRMQQLLASRAPGTEIIALHGLGGSGKTLLALEYAYRRASDYDVVWWLPAEEPATLAAAFADLAVALRLPGRNEPEQRVAVEAVRQWLGKNGRWLLVFDSVREPKDLAPYLMPGTRGHVIVTSRHAAWRGVAWPLPLRGLKRGDSVEFLLARSGARERSHESQERRAAELASALGDLPLALEQAAAYIEESGTTIGEYLSLFQERQAELLRVGAAGQTVVATWDIAFREVQGKSPAAGELLNLCAFLAPDDIPREALRAAAAGLPPALAAAVRDPMALNEVVRALRSYSLVEGQEDALGVHRLVQATVRGRLSEDERRAWAERAVALVYDRFPHDPTQRDVCRRWLPHARAALAQARAARIPAGEEEEGLLRHVAHYQHSCGFEPDAREMFTRALELAVEVHGPKHKHVAMAHTDLGIVLKELKDLDGARRHAERALAIDEELLGREDPIVATDAINLAGVLLSLGDLAGARRCAERALAIDEALSLPEGPAVARDENNLGAILWRQGEYEAGLQHAERAVALDERHRAPNDPDLARDLNNLGFMLREMGDLTGARERLRRALDIGEAAYGSDDPQVATYHSNLASVLVELRDYDTARGHIERAIAIGEATYGPDHYAVAIRRNNLALLLMDMDDLVGARAEMARAVEIATRALGPDHRRVKKLENNLAEIERRLSRANQR
jgi:tetratricopeptide (TPR) repeat protein